MLHPLFGAAQRVIRGIGWRIGIEVMLHLALR